MLRDRRFERRDARPYGGELAGLVVATAAGAREVPLLAPPPPRALIAQLPDDPEQTAFPVCPGVAVSSAVTRLRVVSYTRTPRSARWRTGRFFACYTRVAREFRHQSTIVIIEIPSTCERVEAHIVEDELSVPLAVTFGSGRARYTLVLLVNNAGWRVVEASPPERAVLATHGIMVQER